MSAADQRQVDVGGNLWTIEKFSTRKFAAATKTIGRVADQWREFQVRIEQIRKEYAETHPVLMTRDMAHLRVAELRSAAAMLRGQATQAEMSEDEGEKAQAQQIAAAASDLDTTADYWQRLVDGPLSERESITTPGEMPNEEMILAVLRDAMADAEDELAEVVGLIVMTNAEVAQARKQGDTALSEACRQRGDDILDQADPDDVLDLVVAGGEMLLGNVGERKGKVGKLRGLFRQEDQPEQATTPEEPSPPSMTSKPSGSTSSETPTDGSPTSDLTASTTGSPSDSDG